MVGGAPDQAHYGIAVEIEKRVKSIQERGEKTPARNDPGDDGGDAA